MAIDTYGLSPAAGYQEGLLFEGVVETGMPLLDEALRITLENALPEKALDEIHRMLCDAQVRNPNRRVIMSLPGKPVQYDLGVYPVGAKGLEDDVMEELKKLEDCLELCAERGYPTSRVLEFFWTDDEQEEIPPVADNLPRPPRGNDRIWQHENKRLSRDAESPKPRANVSTEERLPLSVSPFVGSVLANMMNSQIPDGAVDYLDWVGDLAIYGGGPEVRPLPQQPVSRQDELLMAGEGMDAWIEQIGREAAGQGIEVHEHPHYPAYQLRMEDLDELAWLACKIEQSKQIPDYVPAALEMYLAAEAQRPDTILAATDVLWRDPAENLPLEGAWSGADVHQVLIAPEYIKGPNDTQPIPVVVLSAEQEKASLSSEVSPHDAALSEEEFAESLSMIASTDEALTIRKLWKTHRWRLRSIEGIKERANICLEIGRLVLGSASTVEDVYKSAFKREAKQVLDKEETVRRLEQGFKPNKRLDGTSRTVREFEFNHGRKELRQMSQWILIMNDVSINKELVR